MQKTQTFEPDLKIEALGPLPRRPRAPFCESVLPTLISIRENLSRAERDSDSHGWKSEFAKRTRRMEGSVLSLFLCTHINTGLTNSNLPTGRTSLPRGWCCLVRQGRGPLKPQQLILATTGRALDRNENAVSSPTAASQTETLPPLSLAGRVPSEPKVGYMRAVWRDFWGCHEAALDFKR